MYSCVVDDRHMYTGKDGVFRGANAPDLAVQTSETTVAYRGWLIALAVSIALIAAVIGVRMAMRASDLQGLLTGGTLTLPFAVAVGIGARRMYKRFRGVHRLRRSRCVHCGYSIREHARTRCPECGKDVIE